MKRSATAVRIGAELVPVLLVLGCLAGSLALILAAYQRQAAMVRDRTSAVVAVPPEPTEPPKPLPVPKLTPPPAPEPSEDPAAKIVASIEAQADAERAATAKADAKTATLEAARQEAEAEVARWKQRERLVRDQANRLDDLARHLEIEADALARLRDVLTVRRDQEKADLALAESRARDAFAILPYRGEHGTWRRPIALECRNGKVKIQPDGPTFNLLELGGLGYSARSSPIVAAVYRTFARVRHDVAPDGAPIVPYILFLIRPDGIRAYYEARGQLERLGIAFGYELVEQDMNLDYPDLDDPSEWPGAPRHPTPPIRPSSPSTLAEDRPDVEGQSGTGTDGPYVWHAQEPPPPPPSVGTGGGLSFSDLERGLPGGLLADAAPEGGGFDVDGLDLSGPPIAYEPDPRRPGTGGGSRREGGGWRVEGGGNRTEPRRPGNGSRSLTDLGGTDGHPSDLRPPSSRVGLGLPGDGRGLGLPDGGQGLGLPGDGRGLARLGNERRGGQTEVLERPGELAGLPTDRTGMEGPPGVSETQGGAEQPGRPSGTAGGRGPGGEGSGRLTQAEARPGSGQAVAMAGQPNGTSDRNPGESTARSSSSSHPGGNAAGAAGRKANAAAGGASAASPTAGLTRSPGQGAGAPSLGGSGSNPVAGLGIGLDLPSSPLPGGETPPASGLLNLGMLPGASANADQPEGPKPLSLVIDCRPDGVTIQPGGYRLSRQALENSDLLVRRLRAIVQSDPAASRPDAPTPWLNFLVQPGGQEIFWLARRQTTFAGLNWPARLQVVESGGLGSFTGRFR